MVLFYGRGSGWPMGLGLAMALAMGDAKTDQVQTKGGVVEGLTEPGVRVFRGIP